MTVSAVTGKPGSGKNLFSLFMLEKYGRQGRRLVANFKVDLRPLWTWWERKFFGREAPVVEQLPGRPTYDQLIDLGKGGPREHRAGLLVLDEVGPLFNSREWQAKDRARVIDWLQHHRKLAWDILLIVQDVSILDKQIRSSVVETCVRIKRLDKLKMLGIKLPRAHMAIERYGVDTNAQVIERRFFRGTQLFKCYDTTELVAGELASAYGVCDPALELPARTVEAPCGVKSPGCQVVGSPELAAFWFEVASTLGLCRTDLPAGYLAERARRGRAALSAASRS